MAIITFIENFKAFNYNFIRAHHDLITNECIKDIGKKYDRSVLKRNVDLRFNLFTVISDQYQRENLHSDILAAFLKEDGYKEDGIYLQLFIEYLNTLGANINTGNYQNPQIFREKGRIDLLIQDKDSYKAIIVENKINNAPDMYRQLPRYVEKIGEENCDCIVYLTLNHFKFPDIKDWTDKDYSFIKSKMVNVIAYNETENDFYNGWITKSERITSNIDALLILRQYGALIKELGGNIMNKVIVGGFYEQMLDPEKFKTAQSVRSMLNDLISYRVEVLYEYFRNNLAPFKQIGKYQDYIVELKDCISDRKNWQIGIGVYEEEYKFEFFEKNSNIIDVKKMMTKMGVSHQDFYEGDERMKKRFKFPEDEEKVKVFVDDFKSKLIQILPTSATELNTEETPINMERA